jgi:hypothetical protein
VRRPEPTAPSITIVVALAEVSQLRTLPSTSSCSAEWRIAPGLTAPPTASIAASMARSPRRNATNRGTTVHGVHTSKGAFPTGTNSPEVWSGWRGSRTAKSSPLTGVVSSCQARCCPRLAPRRASLPNSARACPETRGSTARATTDHTQSSSAGLNGSTIISSWLGEPAGGSSRTGKGGGAAATPSSAWRVARSDRAATASTRRSKAAIAAAESIMLRL